ncbi:MAG: hypothetical protein AAGG69_01260 [Pseudomonadota bacterium]
MTKAFGRLARRRMDDAYARFHSATKREDKHRRLDENIAWFSYFVLVFTGVTQFTPEASAMAIVTIASVL